MEKVAILDCGGQYTKVIDRKVRELGVYTDIFPISISADKLKDYRGIILSGGPASVWAKGSPSCDSRLFELGIPMLGICYGMQLLSDFFGGEVRPGVTTEYGEMAIDIDISCPMFTGLCAKETVLMSHGDVVVRIPDGFKVVASTGGAIAGVYSEAKRIIGVQFHPEVELTEHGMAMFENFLRKVCGLTEIYALEDRIQTSIDMIRSRVGEDGKVVVLVSGGVDSAVTAALLCRALRPDQVYGIHIDHGLMRKNESDLICKNLSDLGLVNMQRINAEDDFFHTPLVIDGEQLKPLSETCEPEKKRAIIGQMFFEVTEKAARDLHLDFDTAYLAQGTLRPDLIESGNPMVSGFAHKIKTHHNDVGVIRALRDRGHVIETNWDWHKDEVRKVARMLGLDEAIASRQPFPGPGLGVRLICCDAGIAVPDASVTALDAFMKTQNCGLSAAIAPIQSVGVQGDCRSYKNFVILSGGKADTDYEKLFTLARDIPNALNFLNRAVYRVDSDEPVGKINCAGMHICRETADLLREIDDIVTRNIMNPKIAQCFAVLLPISAAGDSRKYSCVIRAVCTTDFMTARPARPGKDFSVDALKTAVSEIKAAVGKQIGMILLDVSGKPPATVEWE